MSLDVRQAVYRGILSELFPYASGVTLDLLLQSIDADCTVPLRVDATNAPSLVVNVGAAIVSNPESNRQKSISFINNAIPAFSGGTVTFPSSSGGNITTSTGGSYLLTLPSGDYAAVLLSLDSSGNLVATPGAPAASAPAVVVPTPVADTLPFAYVVLHNLSGTIQNVVQSTIFQFAAGSGGGSGGGGGAAQEVPVSSGATNVVVTLVTAQASVNYVVLAQLVNVVDGSVQYQPVTITNRTNTTFTASWNAPTDSANYFLDYLIPPGITQEQAGEMILSSGVNSVTVTIPIPLSSISYVVVAELVNLVDASPQYQPLTVTNKTVSSFQVKWNADTDSANYRLAWQLAAYQ